MIFFVQAFGSLGHGSLADLSVAFLGNVHVPAFRTGDGVGGRVGSLTDVEENVLVVFQQFLGFFSLDVLHGDIFSLSSGGRQQRRRQPGSSS